MHPSVIDPQNLIDLKILIIIAVCLLLSPHIAKFLRLSLSATEIMLGALVAYFGLVGESGNFKLLANIGFAYLMFIAGMEVNLHNFFSMDKKLAQKSFLYILLLYTLSSLLVWTFGLHYIFILIIPVMSVGLLSMLYKDFGRECYWLNVSMLVATLAEVVSIVLLTLVGAFLNEETSALDVAKSVLYLNLFLALCIIGFKLLKVLFWWYPQLQTLLMPWDDKNEKDIRFCVAIFIFIVVTMMITKLEVVLGAFIAGSFISTFFNHKKDLEHKLSSFGYGFLIPIFFLYIGTTFDLSLLLNYEVVLQAFFLMFSMVILRIISALIFYKKIGFKNMLLFALSHSMPLTLLIATATLSYSAKLITPNLYSALILTAFLEAVLIMSMIKFLSNSYK
ncbi:cation:proton antiporter [Campylobacter helveticus]|uniref:Cation:proton antiporter n=1 Tax=Campylobacter helveticus TaxID=28898 RepID=A0AAX2ULE6_9BACT|nr:cation:proton antiporter [Campylobacter helveticus]ARE79761.1 Na+/H+ exchanger family protein [Campylobacter helveticus]MCR2038623.1 cation:proton antiporter [Campylobacter helveticus]MCR2054531.1 cation:proton antiporter [Campylobacter helveticus]MCR2056460.1 cation:proton antiporter [Campylobacter helveticus]MCR2059607.1 cation:proton antiporter [Campylobacter helveticus]